MCGRLSVLVYVVAVLMCMVGVASAAEIKVDWGSQGTLDSSWTEWATTSGSKIVDGVQFTLSNSGLNGGAKIRPWRGGVGDKLIVDCLSAEDEPSGGSYTLQITNLAAGDYEMVTYHNMGDAKSVGTSAATLDSGHGGASDTTNTGHHAASYTDLTEATGLTMLSFTSSGTSDTVTITYTHTGDMPAVAGFTLTLAAPPAPTIEFASDSSGDLETVSPALVEVVLASGDPAETYTVDYAVVGGTATKGDDYTLVEPDTLTFGPGEISKMISIDIIDDGVDEDDESIILELSNPTGPDAVLGDTTQHTYAIRDPRVGVGFALDSSVASEDISPVNIEVCLSDSSTQTVTVDYAVTSGTATPGDDYTLTAGTLTFTPGGGLCQNISVALVDDDAEEGSETVIIELSNPGNAKLSIPSQHTLTIQDPSISEGTQAIDLKVDIGACGGHLGPPDYLCDPSGSYQTIKEGWTDWTAWDPDLPGGEACVDWYERKTKTVADIQMELLRVGQCSDQYGLGLRFKNASGGPLTRDGVRVNNLPNDDDPNPCGGDPKLKLTITGIPEVASYNYQMTSWHNELGDACYSPTVNISVNGSQVVSSLPISRTAPDDESAAKATYQVSGGTLVIEFTGASNKGNITINGFRLTDGAGAAGPMPADGELNVEPDVEFSWTPGQYALTHQVYLGTNPDALQFQGHVAGNSFQPPAWLDLGQTYYWRIHEVNGAYPESPWRGPVWSFTTAGAKAREPNPADDESDVGPIPTLSWTPAPPAESHDVYLGTDETAVANATTFSTQFQDNVDVNSFEPGLLDFGRTYYWRIDEVNDAEPASPWIGDVWAFTVHNGKASDPNPPDGSNTPTPYVILGWTAAPLTDSHDVYFGTNEAAVANATTGSSEYKGNRTSTSFDPRPLSEGVTYYWRIDEVGTTTRKGDVWSFTAVAPVNMQVDFAPEVWGNPTQAIPGTHKPGWIPFMPGGWGDLYMHDFRGIQDLGGTGVDVCITGCAEGRSGMKVYGMCMDNKAGGAAPNGSAVGEPIANSWFTSVDRCAGPLGVEGSSQLGIYNLPAGTYEVKMYHNLWEPSSDKSRECTNDAYGNRSPMDIHVRSLAEQWAWRDALCAASLYHCGHAGDALNKMTGFAGPNPGNNVVAIEEAFGIQPTSVQTDADVATSLVKFWTDGSPVILHCQTGEEQDSQYRGDRAAINAFELRSVPQEEEGCPCLGDVSDTGGFGEPDGKVDIGDINALLFAMLGAYPDGDPTGLYEIDAVGLPCGADVSDAGGFGDPDGKVDIGDLNALLFVMLEAYPEDDDTGMYEVPCLE